MNTANQKNFSKFKKQLELLKADIGDSARRVVSQMADVGLASTKKATPVGKYPAGSGKVGGTLRKGWQKTPVHKAGRGWTSGYTNNVYYAVYVNNGHRLIGKDGRITGYLPGQRMLEKGITQTRKRTHGLFTEEIARVKRKTGF